MVYGMVYWNGDVLQIYYPMGQYYKYTVSWENPGPMSLAWDGILPPDPISVSNKSIVILNIF